MSYKKKRVRFTIDVNFSEEEEKRAFCEKLSAVRDRLSPVGSPSISNQELLLTLFNVVLAESLPGTTSGHSSESPTSGSFLKNSG